MLVPQAWSVLVRLAKKSDGGQGVGWGWGGCVEEERSKDAFRASEKKEITFGYSSLELTL